MDDNDKLLTSVGVFAALTTIFVSRSDIDPSLSFFSFLLFLLLCLELLLHYLISIIDTKKEPTGSLILFGVFFLMLMVGIAYQIKDLYYSIIVKLFSPMFALFYALIASLSIHQFIIKKIKRFTSYKLWIFLIIFFIILGFFLFLFSL